MTREEMRDNFEWHKDYWLNAIHEAVEQAQEDCEDCREHEYVMRMYLNDTEHAEEKIIGMLELARSCNIISIPEYDKYFDEVLTYWKDAYNAIKDIANN